MKHVLRMAGIMLVAAMALAGCSKDEDIIISAVSNNDAYGTVNGTGAYAEGETVTLKATPAEGYKFVRWQDGNTDNPRTFKAKESAVYTAYFGREITGNGETHVTWMGETWKASEIYLVQKDNSIVSLEIYKDASDVEQPYVIAIVPTTAGTYSVSEGGSMAFLPLDFQGQTADYYGQQVQPYQAAQGATLELEEIDLVEGTLTGHYFGYYVYLPDYLQDQNNPETFELEVDFSKSAWTDLSGE